MPVERVIKPVIEKSLSHIEDQLVVDMVHNQMSRLKAGDRQMYDRNTHTGESPIFQHIAYACAIVSDIDLEPHDIWSEALAYCISEAEKLVESYEQTQENGETGGANYLIDKAVEFVKTSFAMYAIDRYDGYSSIDHMYTSIDRLCNSTSSGMQIAVEGALYDMEQHGLVVVSNTDPDCIPVTTVVRERIGAYEDNAMRYALWQAADCRTRLGEPINLARNDHSQLRYSTKLRPKDFDALLDHIGDFGANQSEMTASALNNLPDHYLHQLHSRASDDKHRQRFEEAMTAFASSALPKNASLSVLHRYFPGGLIGDNATHHPVVTALRERYASDAQMLCSALPDIRMMKSSQRPECVRRHNRETERVIDGVLALVFPDMQFREIYRTTLVRSLTPRCYQDDIPAYDYKKVRDALDRLVTLGETFGAENLMRLHRTFDLSAIDHLTERDLATWLGVLDRDPEIIESLKAQDVTVVAFDAFSHNQATKNILDGLDAPDSRLGRFVIPWIRPGDFEEKLALLREAGVPYCTLAFAVHGGPGTMSCNKGPDFFIIPSGQLPAGASYSYPSHQTAPRVYLRQLHLGRRARDDMVPPKFAADFDLPDKKRIFVISCYGDDDYANVIPSIAAGAIHEVDRSDTVVIAPENIAFLSPPRDDWGLAVRGPGYKEIYNPDREYGSNLVVLEKDTTHPFLIKRSPYSGGRLVS